MPARASRGVLGLAQLGSTGKSMSPFPSLSILSEHSGWGVGVLVLVGEGVLVGVLVLVGVNVAVGVLVAVLVAVAVGVRVDVAV